MVVVMSGDFVRRGEPAIYDKYIRTRIALKAGADLILELPDNDGLKIFQKDLFASHLRQTLVYHKSGRRHPDEYTRSVTIRPD